MTTLSSTSQLPELDGGPLGRLVFQWIGDRFQHGWFFGGPHPDTAALQSLEADAADPWPISPPLQQVYRQSLSDGREVMFAVGMAGRGHWSASFTLVPDLKCWLVELACCAPLPPPPLVSSYRLHGPWQIASPADDGQPAACLLTPVGLKLEPLSPLTRLQVDGQQLAVMPQEIASNGTTTQWGFRLRMP